MEGQRSQGKLTRTQSSLLRLSPTARSSIHSLSSVEESEEEKKPLKPLFRPRPGINRFGSVFALFSPIFCIALYLSIFYLRRNNIPTSENVLLLLLFLAVSLFLASRNKTSVHHSFAIIRKLCNKKLGFRRNNSRPVQWFIGETSPRENLKLSPLGVEFYTNGDLYEGEFHNGRSNGSGVYSYFVNGRYEGDWVDGRYDGYGVESWARGSRYRGQYLHGLRHGFGVYKFYTGDSYAGEWINGQSHGVGLQTCSDGSCYTGEFKRGLKHGLGFYHFRNGDGYSGEYFNDKIQGFGVYKFANGHCYKGSWHEGRRQGYGLYTFRNGETKCGEWDKGTLKYPLPLLDPSLVQAVEAAQKTADDVIHLPRVNEEMNKAVMAANRSATAARVAAIRAVQNRIDGSFCQELV